MATVNELSTEINMLQEENRQKTSQLNASQQQISELRTTLEDLRMQMAHQVNNFK